MRKNNWNLKFLGEIVEFLDGKRVPLKDAERAKMQGKIPYYGANGKIDSVNKYLFDEPLILLAEDGGHFGSKSRPIAYKIEGKNWVNNHAHLLRPINGLNIDFLKWSLAYYDVTKFTTGSTRVKLTKGDALKMQIPIPDLKTQQKIVSQLDQVDKAKQKRKQANQRTEQFMQSVFLEMFGDPVKNEKGWKLATIGDLCEIRRGASPRPIDKFTGGTIPWIKISDATAEASSLYIFKTKVYVTKEGAAKSVFVPEGSLIFANCVVSLGFARIMKVCGCIHDGWLSLFNFSKEIDVLFLLSWINQMTNYLRKLAPDGTQPNLNTTIMRNLKFPLPPLPLQQKFAKVVEQVEQLRNKQRESEKELDNLFQSLMQKYFG